MRFLFRLAFWLGIVLVLLPSISSQPVPKSDLGAFDAMSAARAAISDIRQFCERQPDACTAGSQVAVAIGHRAQVGAKMLYEFLNDQLGPQETGTISGTDKPSRASQHTLTPADLEPAWRGPQPQRDPRSGRA
jgi:hypothetical protein